MKKLFGPYTPALIAILLASAVSGGAVVFTKVGTSEIPPFSFTFLRFAIASICILPFFLRNLPKVGKDFYKVVLFSLFLSYNIIIFPFGVRLTTATISQTLYACVPILVAVLSYLFLAEKFRLKKIFGIVIGLMGTLLIVLLPEISKGTPFAGNLTGNLILVTTLTATAIYNTFSKNFQKQYSPMQLTAVFIFTTTFLSIFLAGSDLITNPHWLVNFTPKVLFEVSYVSIVGTIIYYAVTQYVIKHASPLIASFMFYLQPISAFIWAYFLLGEQITSGLIIGALLTFAGVFLIFTTRKN